VIKDRQETKDRLDLRDHEDLKDPQDQQEQQGQLDRQAHREHKDLKVREREDSKDHQDLYKQLRIAGKVFTFFISNHHLRCHGKTTVIVDNPDFQIATDLFQQPSTSSLMPYLDTEFYYTLLIGGDLSFANYYTISEIDDKVAVLQLGIDSNIYKSSASDARYRTNSRQLY
jgi:hypothetical protein